MGSCLTVRKELSEETRADKVRDFIGRRHPGRERQGKGMQENCSATWLTVLGFMVIGLVSRLSLTSHSDSECFLWNGHCSIDNVGACDGTHITQPRWMLERDSGKWTDTRCLLLTFPKLFWLVAAY